MFDAGMILCEGKSIATAITSESYDFGQAAPASGAYADPIVVVVQAKGATTGAGSSNSVTFKIQDSDNDSTFADVLTLPAVPGEDVAAGLVIPLPIKHRRYVKLVTTVTGTVTGTIDAWLSNGYTLPMSHAKQGIEIVQTAD